MAMSNMDVGHAGMVMHPSNSFRATAGRSADEVHRHFTEFVGTTFFGQMIKAMRSSAGEPAYFHGGRAEEVFQSQLDQALADHMTEASAAKFSDPMFRQQFPKLASQQTTTEPNSQIGLSQLNGLTRR